MPLTKNTFEEAKKNASKRISEWIDETKSAGIVRLQDQYSQTFKRIEWKPKQENVKITGTIRKKTEKEKTDKTKEGNVVADKQKSSAKNTNKKDVKPNVKNTTKSGKEEKTSAKTGKKEEKLSAKNTDKKEKDENKTKGPKTNESRAESRMDRNTESRAERNTESRTSRASRGSKNKVYRDSANLLYGDNRNNRSSMFSSCERRSRSSIDAISWIFEGESDPNECETPKGDKPLIISINGHDLNFQNRVPNSKNQGSKQQKYAGASKKKTTGNSVKGKNAYQTPYLGTKNFKKKRTKLGKTDDVDEDELSLNVATVEIQGTLSYMHSDYGLLRNPSRLLQHPRPHQHVDIRVPSVSTAGLTLSSKSRGNLGLLRAPSNMLKSASSELIPGGRQIKGTLSTMGVMRARSMIRRKRIGHKEAPSNINVFDNPEERSEYVRAKFRRLVRKLINIHILLKGSQIKIRKEMGESFGLELKKSIKDARLSFDPSQFKAASNTYGGVTKRAKQILWKEPRKRTEDDIGVLMEVMYRLPFFAKYSLKIKRDLAKILWFDQFEKGRTIIKQDDPGSRMYFVISGTVSLHMTETDPRSGIKHIRHLRDVCSGSMFGELALIRNITRTYTAVCKEETEFLSLSKCEFNTVLRTRWEADWKSRLNFIKQSEHFKDWPEEKIIQCADHSELREYADNKVIFGDENSLTNEVFFIRKGKALMVKKITLVRNKSPYLRPALFLPEMKGADVEKFMNKSYGKHVRSTRQEKHFVTVMTLYPDNYFGVGEDLTDTHVISKGKTECVVINSAAYSINNKTESLKELTERRQSQLPSTRELYHRFETNRRWMEYKKKLVEEVVQRKNIPNNTTVSDIPCSLLLEPRIPDNLIL